MNSIHESQARNLVEKMQYDFSEWIEMSDNPSNFLVGVLANKVVSLQNYIEFLEKRIEK